MNRLPVRRLAATLLLAGLVLAALPHPLAAQASPFTAAPPRQEEAPAERTQRTAPRQEARPGGHAAASLAGRLTARLAPLQQEANRRLAALGRELRDEPFGPSFWVFMALAAGYGALHALGPGHGKTMVGAYFLARGHSRLRGYLEGLLVSLAASGAHTLSGVLLVLAAGALLLPVSSSLDQAGSLLMRLSAAALTLAGLVMALRAARELRGREQNHDEARSAPRQDGADALPALRDGLGVALAVGVVPCPVAALVFSFCLTLGIAWAGAAAMLAMALGMGLTTFAFAAFAIACRGALGSLCAPSLPRIAGLLSLAGGVLLALFGGLALLV